MSVRAVCKFRLRGRPFSGTMDRAVNSNLEEVQELRNGPNKANFDGFCIRKPREEHNFIFTKRKLAFLREENDSLLNLVKVPLNGPYSERANPSNTFSIIFLENCTNCPWISS